MASKGLGLVYEMGGEADQQTLVSTLVEALMTGKRSVSHGVDGWRNKVRELQEVKVYSEHVAKLLLYFYIRVKHAVSEDTEVFQGEGLGKTPDG